MRVGELVRASLADLLRRLDLRDPALQDVSITVTEVRMSPDLKHATVFVEPLGGRDADEVVGGLMRCRGFLRGQLGHAIDLKYAPDLVFREDTSFDRAAAVDALLDRPEVSRDLKAHDDGETS